MHNGEFYETDDAITTLHALHAALTHDLEELQQRIPGLDGQRLAEHLAARTSLHSGLASIAEVLAWIECKTEDDPAGDVAVAIEPLPTLRGCSIH